MIGRGDIHWVDLEPLGGSGSNKRRPAIVVSDAPLERLEGAGRAVRSINVARLCDQVGVVPAAVLARVDAALRLHLDL